MDSVAWVFSAVLAVVLLITGVIRAFFYEQARKSFPWVGDVPRWLVHIIGVAEIVGALGLILPAATGVYAWLTPLAAVAVGSLMLLAAGFHAWRHEGTEAALSVIMLLLTAFLAYSRWSLML